MVQPPTSRPLNLRYGDAVIWDQTVQPLVAPACVASMTIAYYKRGHRCFLDSLPRRPRNQARLRPPYSSKNYLPSSQELRLSGSLLPSISARRSGRTVRRSAPQRIHLTLSRTHRLKRLHSRFHRHVKAWFRKSLNCVAHYIKMCYYSIKGGGPQAEGSVSLPE